MYNYPYNNIYNPQSALDRINSQMAELEKQKSQLQQIPVQQPTNLTQNFQLAPSNSDVIRYANSIDEVQKNIVLGDTPYFSKDMSIVWVKNTQNQIKTYELKEIVPKDEKDIQIELLQEQIEELRKEMKKNEQYDTNANSAKNQANTTRNDEPTRNASEESKSPSISRVPTGKK